jgi:hypothetical protein
MAITKINTNQVNGVIASTGLNDSNKLVITDVTGRIATPTLPVALVTQTTAGTLNLTANSSNTVILSGTTIDQIVNLGDATTYPIGKMYNLLSDNTNVIAVVNGADSDIARLEPYNEIQFILTDNTTDQGVWFQKVIRPDVNRMSTQTEDWLGATPAGLTGMTSSLVSGGTNVIAAGASGTPYYPQIRNSLQLGTGTQATGRAASFKSSTLGMIFGNNKTVVFETSLLFPILSTITEEYTFQIGYGETVGNDQVDGVYFEYNRLTNDDFWTFKTASNNIRTTLKSSIPIVNNTFIKLRIEVSHNGEQALGFVNDVPVGLITTNIPTTAGRISDWIIRIQKSAGTTTRLVFVDYLTERIYYTNR